MRRYVLFLLFCWSLCHSVLSTGEKSLRASTYDEQGKRQSATSYGVRTSLRRSTKSSGRSIMKQKPEDPFKVKPHEIKSTFLHKEGTTPSSATEAAFGAASKMRGNVQQGELQGVGQEPRYRNRHLLVVQESQGSAEEVRVFLFQYVLQTMALLYGRDAAVGQVTSTPTPLGTFVEQLVVLLNTSDLISVGYTIREVTIPPGVSVPTSASQVLLVYRSFASEAGPYSVTGGTLNGSVVGLHVYAAPGFTSEYGVTPLAVTANTTQPFSVQLPVLETAGVAAALSSSSQEEGEEELSISIQQQCVAFNMNGSEVESSEVATAVAPANRTLVCASETLADFGIISLQPPPPPPQVPAPAPVPAPPLLPPVPAPDSSAPALPAPVSGAESSREGHKGSSALGIGLGVGLVGGVALLAATAAAALLLRRHRIKALIRQMQEAADRGPPLETALIAGSRRPTAGAMRTTPVPEMESSPNA